MAETKKIINKTKTGKYKDIDFIERDSNILLIAPHAVVKSPFDDENTVRLTRRIAKKIGCSSVINRKFRKPPAGKNADMTNHLLDLNIVEHAEQVKEFIDSIKDVVDNNEFTYIFWIHGIKNENIRAIDPDAECLIGYGQPNNNNKEEEEEPRYTAAQKIIPKLIEKFSSNGIKAIEAPPDSIYRGHDVNRMNQYFRNNRYPPEKVQSIQLEFKYTGIRATESLDSAAKSIAQAIKETTEEDVMTEVDTQEIEQSPVDKAVPAQDKEQVQPDNAQPAQDQDDIPDAEVLASTEETKSNDTKSSEAIEENKISHNLPAEVKKVVEDIAVSDDVIQEVYEHLKNIFVNNFQDATYKSMLECGQYLVAKFYGTYEKAQEKKFTRTESMSKLIKKIRDNASDGNIPSRTWVYDAVNLAIDHYLYEQKKLPSAYGQLGHSQKVNLTYAPNLESKIKMIETLDKPTVAQIRKCIADEKAKFKKDTISFKETIVKDKLKKLRTTTLESYIKQIEEFEKKLEEQKKIYEANRQILAEALEEANKKTLEKKEKAQKKKSASKTTATPPATTA